MAYTTARTGYAPVNGLQMYHEIHGTAPALVVIGDSDVVGPEHAVRMFRLLGGGVAGDVAGLPASRLAVLPGTTHITLVDRSIGCSP